MLALDGKGPTTAAADREPQICAPDRTRIPNTETHGQIQPARPLDPAVVFKARCEARARLYSAGELTLHEAVDKLQHDAVATGLVALIGQDAVQALMSAAFGAVRAKPTAWDIRDRDYTALAALKTVIWQNDPVQFRKWMTQLSAAERQAVRDLLVTA
jgi:hypothetical protein